MLRDYLNELEGLLLVRAPEILQGAKLRRAATNRECDALASVMGVAELPTECVEWFQWHDGQEGGASILAESADLGGWLLVPMGEAQAHMKWAQASSLSGWRKSYLPILENRAGDFCVVDASTRGLRMWWHEGEPGAVVGRSIEEFFSKQLEAWREILGRG